MLQRRRKQEERRKAEFGENPFVSGKAARRKDFLDEIRLYYEETKGYLPEEKIDEVTWNDLEMDEVFFRINHTRSYIGEQVLYRRLHDTSWLHEEKVQKEWEKKLIFYEKEEAGRLKLEEKLEAIGKEREDYYLPLFLLNTEVLKVEHIWIYQMLQVLLAVSFLLAVVLGSTVLFTVFVGIVLINISVYAMCKVKYEAHLYALGSVKRLVLFCKMVTTRPEWESIFDSVEIKTEVKKLEKLTRLVGNFEAKKRGILTGDVMDLLRDYLIGATLWDITTFNRIVTLLDGKKESLLKLYEFAGEVDMGISVASFRASLKGYCWPEECLPKERLPKERLPEERVTEIENAEQESVGQKTCSFGKTFSENRQEICSFGKTFSENRQKTGSFGKTFSENRQKTGSFGKTFSENRQETCSFGQAFSENRQETGTRRYGVQTFGLYHPLMEAAVCNDFNLQRNCMITGANASGKSTFIKALAVNAVLAQTIHTCTAKSFQMPAMRVLTSMAVRDDILSGESYYIREIGYLKRIVEAVDGKIPVLCMIDEILRGTNTAERIAASEAVLRYLAEKNCIAVVATHDMELVENLKEEYDSYYFKSDIRDDDILFDYKIYKGVGENRNAIKLLHYMKFPREIVEKAEQLAEVHI